MTTHKVEISSRTIVFTVLFGIALLILWRVKDLLFLFYLCFLLAECIGPVVGKLEKLKVPRPLGIAIVYVAVLSALSFVIAGIVPPLIEQTGSLIKVLPQLVEKIDFFHTPPEQIYSQLKLLENLPANITKTTLLLFGNVFSFVVVLMISSYIAMEKKNFPKYCHNLLGEKRGKAVMKIINSFEERLGGWLNGELSLMIVIGLMSYIGFLVLGIEFALPLAILAGILEVVPNIGPTVSTIVAALTALSVSPLIALLTVIWGVVIQQLENNIIVPKVMNKAVGLHPLITIFVLAIGSKVAGATGAIIAIPTYLLVSEIVKNIFPRK